jgi:hypothetical protein
MTKDLTRADTRPGSAGPLRLMYETYGPTLGQKHYAEAPLLAGSKRNMFIRCMKTRPSPSPFSPLSKLPAIEGDIIINVIESQLTTDDGWREDQCEATKREEKKGKERQKRKRKLNAFVRCGSCCFRAVFLKSDL